MNPVEYDGVKLLLINGTIGSINTEVLIEGTGNFDGKTFVVVSEQGHIFEIPENKWEVVPKPLTGKWEKKYPNSEYYIEFHN